MKYFAILLAAVGVVATGLGDSMTIDFRLDCREGMLSVTNVVDILPVAYSGADWGTGSGTATVTVSKNGETPEAVVSDRSDTGVMTWTPATYGIYTLVHTSSVTSETRSAVISYGLPSTVTFDANTTDAVSGLPAGRTVPFGVTTPEPESVPTRKDYRFDAWCTTAECTTPFDFENTLITEPTTLYAKWVYRPSCMTVDLPFDCIEGTRTITNSVQILPIVYSGSCWSTTNGTVRVTVAKTGGGVQDLVLDRADTGSAKWIPKENGFYTLTHDSTVTDLPLTATFEICRPIGFVFFVK